MDTITRNYEWEGIASENCHINFKVLCAEQFDNDYFKLSEARRYRRLAREGIENYLYDIADVDIFPPDEMVEEMTDDFYKYLDENYHDLTFPS